MRIEGFAHVATKDGGCLVRVDGQELPLAPSLRLWNHSPTGFQWGYAGSGPAQLALALLLWAGIGKRDAVDLHQAFKRQFLERLPNSCDFALDVDVPAWVATAQAARRAVGHASDMSER